MPIPPTLRRSLPLLASVAGLALPALTAPGEFGTFAGHQSCGCEEARLAFVGLGSDDVLDAATGRDLLNYAPSRRVDLGHLRLDLDIRDMDDPTMTAVQSLTFTPIGEPLTVLELDAVGFTFGEITGTGGAEVAGVSYDGDRLQVRFSEPVAVGSAAGVRLEYTLKDPVDGLFWTPASPAWPGRPAQIHTQGQPETNRHWFATHDAPNERLTTEVSITVPEGFLASANGRLVSESTSDGRTTFHWLQDRDHPSYLVSLVVGQFDVVDVGTAELPMPVYVPPGRAGDVERTYGNTAAMVRVFEDRFDEPYPWDRYAQLVVHNFGAGGMENTSATTMYDTAIYSEKGMIDDDLDGLIAHELGHQWFGDLITCTNWGHIWLNEGFATYSTALWYEARDGYDAGYLRQALSNFDRVTSRDTLDPNDARAGLRAPMVSLAYEHPWDVFRRAANPYPKGSSVLHMLRMKLGDDIFFRGLAEYVDRFKHDTVETYDFRTTMEDVSGRSLDQFFTQWVHRPGVPALDVEASYDLAARTLTLTVEQTQRVDDFVPAFVFDLPVVVTDAEGVRHDLTIAVDSRRHEATLPLDAEPRAVVVDPELHVLANVSLDLPEAWLIEQLANGPTVPARQLAARALAAGGDGAEVALTDTLYDKKIDRAVRMSAAEALADHRAGEALLSVALDGRDDARVRAAALEALFTAEIDTEGARGAYRRLAVDQAAPYGVQAAALRCLGKLGVASDLGILEMALSTESRDDEVRQAAIRGLRDLDTAAGLAALLPYVESGVNSRTRPVAIGAVAALSEHDPTAAFDAVAPQATDRREARSRTAAIAAIAEIRDERGTGLLRRLARTAEHPVDRQRAGEAADALAALLRDGESTADLRRRLEAVEKQLDELRSSREEKREE